jgi:hypothetical protein
MEKKIQFGDEGFLQHFGITDYPGDVSHNEYFNPFQSGYSYFLISLGLKAFFG